MGFMVGSLNKVPPWKETLESYFDSHGAAHPLVAIRRRTTSRIVISNLTDQNWGSPQMLQGQPHISNLASKIHFHSRSFRQFSFCHNVFCFCLFSKYRQNIKVLQWC